MVEDHRARAGPAAHDARRRASAAGAIDRYWRCSTSWPGAASSCASCTRRRRRARSARAGAPAPRAGARPRAARVPARPLQGGDRRRRVRLRRQRQLDRRRPRREGRRAGATSSSASRAPTTDCSIASRSCSIASGGAPSARVASCATSVRRRWTASARRRPAEPSDSPQALLRRPMLVFTFPDDMACAGDGDGIITLVKETASGFGQLVADHIRLARVEMTADAKSYARDIGDAGDRRVLPRGGLRPRPASPPAWRSRRVISGTPLAFAASRSCICSSAAIGIVVVTMRRMKRLR